MSGQEEQRRDHGQLLDHLVLVLGDQRLVVVACAREQLTSHVDLLARAEERVVGVRELALDRLREQPVRADVEGPVDDAPDCGAGRAHDSAGVDEIVAERREPTAHLTARPVLDVILELVDLRVGGIHDVEVRLGDVVDESVDELTDRRVARDPQACRVPRRSVRRRLPDRHEELRRGHEPDLPAHETVLLRTREDRHEQAVRIASVPFEQRPRRVVRARGRSSRTSGSTWAGREDRSSSRVGSTRSCQRAATDREGNDGCGRRPGGSTPGRPPARAGVAAPRGTAVRRVRPSSRSRPR